MVITNYFQTWVPAELSFRSAVLQPLIVLNPLSAIVVEYAGSMFPYVGELIYCIVIDFGWKGPHNLFIL